MHLISHSLLFLTPDNDGRPQSQTSLSICTYMAIASHLIASASLMRYTGVGEAGRKLFL
jgi:hypothetical protein